PPAGHELPGRGGRRRRGPGGGGRARLRPPGARMSLDLESLKRLTLRVRRGMGDRPGDRRFPGRPEPAGIELEAYGAYVPGDDLRRLDWNAVGRLDTLLVRRFTAERELVVHLLLDASASMAVPARDRKLALARELALGLAYVALGANDAVRIAVLAGDGATHVSPLLRQRGSLARAAALLAAVAPGGVLALRARRWEVLLLHVIGAGELDPGREFTAGVLTDVETGATRPIVLTPAARARYRELVAEHLGALAALAERTRAVYARLATDASVREFLSVELPRLGVLGRR